MSLLYDFAFIFVALFALGFTIFIHELGHFLAARQRGLVILRFSIGFGPKLFGWTRNGVEYRLSAIPFGGYVALPQLADMGRLEGQRELENDPYSENGEKNFKWKDMDNREENEEEEETTVETICKTTTLTWAPEIVSKRALLAGFENGVIRVLARESNRWRMTYVSKPHWGAISRVCLVGIKFK